MTRRISDCDFFQLELIRRGEKKKEKALTANSSSDRYLFLIAFIVIVPRSIGCLTASVYPGTSRTLTGSKKNA